MQRPVMLIDTANTNHLQVRSGEVEMASSINFFYNQQPAAPCEFTTF